jgi:hypothetical protein
MVLGASHISLGTVFLFGSQLGESSFRMFSLVSPFVLAICSYITREGLSAEGAGREGGYPRLWRVEGTGHCIQLWEKELPLANRVCLCFYG